MNKILYFFSLDVNRPVDANLILEYLKYDYPGLFKYAKLKEHNKYKYIIQISMLSEVDKEFFDVHIKDVKDYFNFTMKNTGSQEVEGK